MTGDRVGEYLTAVRRELPRGWAVGESALRDLRLHIEAAVEEGAREEEAVARLGRPAEVASSLLERWEPEPASLWHRLVAFLVDAGIGWALLWVGVGTIVLLSGGNEEAVARFAWLWWGWLIAGAVLALLYFPAFEATLGRTPGKMLLGLYVVREDGHRPRWKEALLRRLPLFFEFFVLDALFAPFTRDKQRAFDIVARTVVVRGDEEGDAAIAWLIALGLWLLPVVYVAIVNNVTMG